MSEFVRSAVEKYPWSPTTKPLVTIESENYILTDRPFQEIELQQMSHTYRCGTFDCGDPAINHSLRTELPTGIYEQRIKVYYFIEENRCSGFVSVRARSFMMDVIDRGSVVPPITERETASVHIDLLAVDQRDQRKGYGRYLLDHAVALATEVAELIGVRFVTLDSTEAGMKLYLDYGFVPGVSTQAQESTTTMFFDLV